MIDMPNSESRMDPMPSGSGRLVTLHAHGRASEIPIHDVKNRAGTMAAGEENEIGTQAADVKERGVADFGGNR
jgi:hypothetical protein